MKNVIFSGLFALAFSLNLHAQINCQTFESFPLSTVAVSSIGNWVMYNSSTTATSPARIRIQAGNGGKVITASDASGATYLLNTQDFDGNWIANGNTCFCLDIKLISDGGTYSPPLQVSHGIRIFSNLNTANILSATNPSISFAFAVTPTYNENDPWRRICLPIQMINPGDPLPGNVHGQWIAGNLGGLTVDQAWNTVIQNVTDVGFFVDATGNNQQEVIGLDNLCVGCDHPNNTCCPDLENLILNSNFNNTTPPLGFNSQYIYDNSSPALNSLLPGEFTITNTAGAAAICPNWPPIKDHTSCPSNGNGNFMVVNGSTGQSTPKKLVWAQTLNIQSGKEYKFCAQFKNLPQCCFDVLPKIDIKFVGNSGYDLLNQTINVTSAANCGWLELAQNFSATTNTALTIQIWLDEASPGDGNDLAIDDIALFMLPPLPAQYNQFTVATSNLGGNTYNITATPTNPLPPLDCGYFWEICEVDNAGACILGTTVSNPSQWWTNATSFPGYNGTSTLSGTAPGIFTIGKRYKIRYGTWCECRSWSQSTFIFEYNTRLRKLMVKEGLASPAPVFRERGE